MSGGQCPGLFVLQPDWGRCWLWLWHRFVLWYVCLYLLYLAFLRHVLIIKAPFMAYCDILMVQEKSPQPFDPEIACVPVCYALSWVTIFFTKLLFCMLRKTFVIMLTKVNFTLTVFVCFKSNVTGAEEIGAGQWSGPACVWGSCRVSDRTEFGSLFMEAVPSPGKRFYSQTHVYTTLTLDVTFIAISFSTPPKLL